MLPRRRLCSLLRCHVYSSVLAVSRSIQTINEAVDVGDPVQTLAALRSPGAGLYGLTSECAQTYQDDLAKVKNQKAAEGEDKPWRTNLVLAVCVGSFELNELLTMLRWAVVGARVQKNESSSVYRLLLPAVLS